MIPIKISIPPGIPKYFNPDRCEVFGRDMLDNNIKIEQFIYPSNGWIDVLVRGS